MSDLIRFFDYKHLPHHLREVSKLISDLANKLDEIIPENAEKTVGLRKLLEAKDCFVRANISDNITGRLNILDEYCIEYTCPSAGHFKIFSKKYKHLMYYPKSGTLIWNASGESRRYVNLDKLVMIKKIKELI